MLNELRANCALEIITSSYFAFFLELLFYFLLFFHFISFLCMTFSGTHVRTVRTGSYPLRMGEYADEEEIEFFSDSEARKAKLSAFSP